VVSDYTSWLRGGEIMVWGTGRLGLKVGVGVVGCAGITSRGKEMVGDKVSSSWRFFNSCGMKQQRYSLGIKILIHFIILLG
jgi:hypothetical protein